MTLPLVRVSGLTWTYVGSKKPALNNIHFDLMPGEVLGVTGSSGAGKTTLTMAMNSLIPNNFHGDFAGSVQVCGKETVNLSVCDLVQDVGLVFQDPETQFMGMTVEEEMVFVLENLGMSDEEIEKRIMRALKMVRMEEYLQRSPFSLSGGQKQKIAIAACLALKPSVLVLDEPTSELDPIGTTEVFNVLKELKKTQDIGIILVSHATEDLASFCDNVLLLSEGEQICLQPTQEFFSNVDMLHQFGVQIPQMVEVFSPFSRECDEPIPITLEVAISRMKGKGKYDDPACRS